MNSLSQAATKRVFRVTFVGSVVNVLLAALKMVAGVVGGSAAMIADAIHSLSDLVTDAVILVFGRVWGKPEDKTHDFGHGKFETLASSIIGTLLVLVGGGIVWSAGVQLWQAFQGARIGSPGIIALVAAAGSLAAKEFLFHYTCRAARNIGSRALEANAWHHRSDALSSLATTIGIGGATLLGENWAVLDPIAALVVGGLVVYVGVGIVRQSLDELLERSLSDEDEDFIIQTISALDEVSEPHHLRTRRIGSYVAIDVHFRVDGKMSVEAAHALTRTIEDKLRARFGERSIINTHVEPLKHEKP